MNLPLPTLKQLRAVCCAADRRPLDEPLYFERERRVFATDGHAMIVLDVDLDSPLAKACLKSDAWDCAGRVAAEFFPTPDGEGIPLRLGALRAWCGEHESDKRCPNACLRCKLCNGDGCKRCTLRDAPTEDEPRGAIIRSGRLLRDRSGPCGYPGCDDEGYIDPPLRLGHVEGAELFDCGIRCAVDCNILARYAALLPKQWDDVVGTVRAWHPGNGPALRFDADGLVLVCMARRGNENEFAQAIVLRVEE